MAFWDQGRNGIHHSDDEVRSRWARALYQAGPVSESTADLLKSGNDLSGTATALSFLPHSAKILHLSGNNPSVHVDSSHSRTLNQPGRGRIARTYTHRDWVSWLCGWLGRFAVRQRRCPSIWGSFAGGGAAQHRALSRRRISVVCDRFGFRLFDDSPTKWTESIDGRTSMNRYQFGAHQQAHSVHGEQNREIGLRAVAAAILYRGDASNVQHTLCSERSAPSTSATRSSDREP